MGILCVFCVYDTIGNRCFEKTSFPKIFFSSVSNWSIASCIKPCTIQQNVMKLMTSNFFLQYITGLTVTNFWCYPIRCAVTCASALVTLPIWKWASDKGKLFIVLMIFLFLNKSIHCGYSLSFCCYFHTALVAVFKFLTLFSFCSQIKYWFSRLGFTNACQNNKQGRPWSDCFFRSSLIWSALFA